MSNEEKRIVVVPPGTADEIRTEMKEALVQLSELVAGLTESYIRTSSQIDQLANFIMEEVPGEPSRSDGAVDCAIRIIREMMRRESERMD